MLKPGVYNYSDVSLRRKEAISKSSQKTTVFKVDKVYLEKYLFFNLSKIFFIRNFVIHIAVKLLILLG